MQKEVSMPFRTPEPPKPPQQQEDDRPPLLRLGGLYPNQKGNALTGNINILYQSRQDEPTLGERWVELLQQCVRENRPLRVLVFENIGKWAGKQRAPYTLHVCLGRPFQESAPVQEPPRQQDPNSYQSYEEAPEPDEPEPEPPAPPPPPRLRSLEPTPRPPVRRVAPRR